MANEPMIPAGMKPWAGGDAAPADWNGGPVLLRDGRTFTVKDAGCRGITWDRPYADRPAQWQQGDVVAYTPRTPTEPERGAADEWVRECEAVWRCAIGDVTTALDVLKDRWVGSRRKAEREAGAVLSGVLDLVWAARDPAAGSYLQANANGKVLVERVRAALERTAS